jgi:hypothetical protein
MLNFLHRTIANPAEGSTSAPVTVTVAGDVLIHAPSRPIRIVRWGFICTTTVNDATNVLALSLDVRPTVGSNVGRITGATTIISGQTGWNASALPQFMYDLAGGTITMVAGTSQLAAGQVAYHEVASQKPSATYSPYYPDPQTAFDSPGGVATGLVIYPGQEVLIAVQPTPPGAGAGKFFLEVEEQAFEGSKSNNAILVSGVPSSIRPTPSDPGTLNRFLN